MLVEWPRASRFAFAACRDSTETALVEVSGKSGLARVTLDRGRTCSERILARGLGHVPSFALVLASTGHQDLAGLEDLHFPAGTDRTRFEFTSVPCP